jgi:anthranilate phosphoribosyltransferase
VLAKLGAEKAWVVHGSDGLDEMTTTGVSHVAVLDHGKISSLTIAPQDVGLEHASLSQLKGGIPDDNADAIRRLLGGAKGAFRDIVLLNSAAALIVADKVRDPKDGIAQAEKAIDSGAAANVLARLEAVSQGFRP